MLKYLFASLAMISCASSLVYAEQQVWVEVDIGIIGAASDDILQSALALAKESGAAGLTIRLDTPGGSLTVTRNMVKSILNADIPVLVWVGPDGARAASAGAFITLAAHVAAMSPGTNIGAAHPVQLGFGSAESDDDESAMSQKIANDTASFMESIANMRGRNVQMAMSFVLKSVSVTAEQALDSRVIDMLAQDLGALYKSVDGREVQLASGQKLQLSTTNLKVLTFTPTLRQRFLTVLSNPDLFYLLFIAGLIGLGFELTHPGALFPGVVGGVAMILALISMSVLPINFGALLLLLAGVAFLVAEMFVPSFGILGIGGFVAFVVGSLLLVDPSNAFGLAISYLTILPGAILVATAALTIGYLVVKSGRRRIASGAEGMIGEIGEVMRLFHDGTGQVLVDGEIWSARTVDAADLPAGTRIKVLRIEGLILLVERVS